MFFWTSCLIFYQQPWYPLQNKHIPYIWKYQHPSHQCKQRFRKEHFLWHLDKRLLLQGLAPYTALSFFTCYFKAFKSLGNGSLCNTEMFSSFFLIAIIIVLKICKQAFFCQNGSIGWLGFNNELSMFSIFFKPCIEGVCWYAKCLGSLSSAVSVFVIFYCFLVDFAVCPYGQFRNALVA